MRRIIGLTGGIATGKSTVAQWLVDAGTATIDADVLAREAVQPQSDIWARIRDRYGAEILSPTGQLDRQRLGEIVFSQAAERHWLEAQIHPYVRDRLEQFIAAQPDGSTAAIVVPLLFEANLTDLATEIWTVFCSPTQQLDRLQARDGLALEAARARIDSQWPLPEKVIRSQVAIDNSGSLSDTYSQVMAALGDSVTR